MVIRDFVKKSLDNQKKLLVILITISAVSGTLAFLLQTLRGESSVYREQLYLEPKRVTDINALGLPVEVEFWDGDTIKVICVAELPLIIEEKEHELKIEQNDDFSVSIFTIDMFRYSLNVFLPRSFEFWEVNVNDETVYQLGDK